MASECWNVYILFIYISFWNRPNKCNWREIQTQSWESIKCKSILRLFNWNPSDIDLLGTLYLDCDRKWCVNEVSPKYLCAWLYNYSILTKRESLRWEQGVRYNDGLFFYSFPNKTDQVSRRGIYDMSRNCGLDEYNRIGCVCWFRRHLYSLHFKIDAF